MPHFIIECSDQIIRKCSVDKLMREVFETAFGTDLFARGDIKVRVRTYDQYILAEGKNDFIHVFGYIREGRTDAQKKILSTNIVARLKELLPEVAIISMNIAYFDMSSYCIEEVL